MAKESGLGWTTLSVDDGSAGAQVIKNDVTNMTISTPRGVQDVTGVDKSAHERLLLLADFSITLTGIFNDAAAGFHTVFKTVPSTSTVRTVSLAVSAQTLATECIASDYSLNRGADGSLIGTVPMSNADGAVPTWS